MKFDPTLPVQIASGRPVRILCTDRAGRYPIVALITQDDGTETLHHYDAEGRKSDSSWSPSLSNVPEKGFINIWHNTVSNTITCTKTPFTTCKEAKKIAALNPPYILIGVEIDMPVEGECSV